MEPRPPALRYVELVKLSDESLMLRLQRGDHDALAVLFDRYHRLVLNIAVRILRDSGEAEDLMQSVFLEVFRTAEQFDPARGTTKVWLLQYVYHRGFNRRHYLALRGLYGRSEDHEVKPAPPGNGLIPNEVIESSRLVQEALGAVSSTQRKILELAFYEGLTMREISQKTGQSFSSVRHNYYRCLEKLRSLLCERKDPALESGERVRHVEP